MIALALLTVVVLALVGQNAWLQVRQAVERRHWDEERRSYVAAALAAQHSQAAAAAVVRPKAEPAARPEPAPYPIDL